MGLALKHIGRPSLSLKLDGRHLYGSSWAKLINFSSAYNKMKIIGHFFNAWFAGLGLENRKEIQNSKLKFSNKKFNFI